MIHRSRWEVLKTTGNRPRTQYAPAGYVPERYKMKRSENLSHSCVHYRRIPNTHNRLPDKENVANRLNQKGVIMPLATSGIP